MAALSVINARSVSCGRCRHSPWNSVVAAAKHRKIPFEEQVVEFLENEGYEIECQYGASKFRLDILVKERGTNLLAIECDGAGYHSSLVARTRDRARQRILEKLGWRVHRVWSTNWWFFEQQEKEAIIAAINAAHGAKELKGKPVERLAQSSAATVQSTQIAPHLPLITTQSEPTSASLTAAPTGRVRETQASDVHADKDISHFSSAELQAVLFQFIPAKGMVKREELLERVSDHLRAPLRRARPILNRIIWEEKRAGRLELDADREHVWRS